INYVGLCVRETQATVDWYTRVFGFELIGNNISYIIPDQIPDDTIFGIYQDSLHKVKIAHMVTCNGVAFGLFEFTPPPSTLSPVRGGIQPQRTVPYICLTDSNPEAVADLVEEASGRKI
ncbi:hypothetical protein BGW36DRAFT_258477, partial [Talaromyces proteolyticus]